MPETYWHLTRCDLFAQIGQSELESLEAVSKFKRFKRRETIYLPVDCADGLMLLVEGRVKICHATAGGKQSILLFIEPGELFGELSLYSNEPRNEYATACEPCKLILIPKSAVMPLIRNSADLSLGITKLVGLRRHRIEQRLKYLLFRSNRERMICLLDELAQQYGQLTPDGIRLNIRLSHHELASIIGSTRETATTVLGQLQHDGLIRIARRTIVITDYDRLVMDVRIPTVSRRWPDPTLAGKKRVEFSP